MVEARRLSELKTYVLVHFVLVFELFYRETATFLTILGILGRRAVAHANIVYPPPPPILSVCVCVCVCVRVCRNTNTS